VAQLLGAFVNQKGGALLDSNVLVEVQYFVNYVVLSALLFLILNKKRN